MKILSYSVLFFALVGSPLFANEQEDPNLIMQKFLSAFDEYDYESYSSCFHSAVEAPEMISMEAMMFWGNELADARRSGFRGEFIFEAYESPIAGLELLSAKMIINGTQSSEGFLLAKEDQHWKIVNTL